MQMFILAIVVLICIVQPCPGLAKSFTTLAIPEAVVVPHLNFELGGDWLAFRDTTGKWQQASNMRLRFGLADYLEIGLDVYNAAVTTDGVGYAIAFQALREKKYIPDLAFGVRQLSDREKYVAGLGIPTETESSASAYGVVGKTFWLSKRQPTRFIIGLGNGYFKSDDNGLAEDMQGVFAGLQQKMGPLRLSLEFDGRSAYAGLWAQPWHEVALVAGVRGLDHLGKSENTFEDATALHIGLSYQAPLAPQRKTSRVERQAERLRFQLEECLKELEDADADLQHRQQQIARLREAMDEDDERFQQYVASEAELYRLKERIKELESRPQTPQIDYARLNRSVNYLNNSFIYFYENKFDLAKKECEQAIALTPNLTMAHTRLGSIYFKLGDYNNALKSWRRALQLEPENTQLREMIREVEQR